MAEKQTFDQLKETLYQEKLDNGLSVYVLPKKGFNKTYATFTTNYGAVDNHFVPLGENEKVKVPDGIAHFLEHKMFEDEKGDVFQVFGEQGASANAFTSFTRTAYLFSSTQEVKKNLTTLLNFVQHPYFTEQSVEKEKGIIGQEIKMYEDNSDWRVFFNLLDNMYHNHPVKIDIAGTIDSIDKITKDDLYTCYNTFYHPSNMALFIVGPVEPEEILQLVRDNQGEKEFKEPEEIERFLAEEPENVRREKEVLPMSVNTPKCLVGYKEPDPKKQGKELLRYELSLQIILELMFGQGSETYQQLYKEGLIDDSFSFDYTGEKTFAFSVIGGDTKDPDALAQKIQEAVRSMKQEGINEEEVERIRKKKIGSFLKQLNSPEFIANQFTRYLFNEMHLYDVIPVLEELTSKDLEAALTEHFGEDQCTISQVVGKKAEESA
ncbi:EF-P 5-aminopentanol modification-associated protein YfmH [Thalassorhabdus alkalitolerans]|uniref:EF-P 5-aminopentanol modification-associated protein YfmH n=1 Tax=Thalassorhabdus alkalitolerans TaxID=2282697 RepID=A0ABW0YMX5_9BACI|nr:pitrilysin family protein [Thalassobacillus sp. C254]